MKWCPNCKYEYRDDITVCADCGAPLEERPRVPRQPGKKKDHVYLTTCETGMDASMMSSYLESEGISVSRIYQGAGSIERYAIGVAVDGVHLLVPQGQLCEARSLLEDFARAQEQDEG